jgi:aminodeoxyfutalosine synthase
VNLFEQALKKGARVERLSREEAFALAERITPDRLHALGRAALANRRRRFGNKATFVFNLQINPANICGAGCTFCNYAASKNDPHAYVLSEEDILDKVAQLKPVEAHIVGGLNQVWPYRRNLELVQRLRRTYPDLHIKCYTAVEIAYFAKTTGKTVQQILEELLAAGMNALTGGGAEIFSERLHKTHWKGKIGPDQWVRIHQAAHDLGIPTNSTMLFGFGDTWRERVEHMLILRQAQDASRGFVTFIPLAFLAVLAIARLVLDNIAHIKSYWPMAGVETAATGLSWGADDMDGTISEEKIAHLAGANTPKGLARDRMRETIQMGGFVPVERDGQFEPMPVV